MCRGYFSSQEIDPHHATEHRSTDQSRNGCGMCCFCHAQPFEITRAKNIKNPLLQRSCQNAKVVEAFCSRRVHHRDRHQHTIPIALAALPGATLPRLRALALFGRRSPQRVDSLVMPASENLDSLRTSARVAVQKSGYAGSGSLLHFGHGSSGPGGLRGVCEGRLAKRPTSRLLRAPRRRGSMC